MKLKRVIRLLVIMFLLVPLTGAGRDLSTQTAPIHSIDHQYETLLINALGKIRDNEIEKALDDLKLLVKAKPNFKLAQLIYADLLLARSRPITDFGHFSALPYDYVKSLREEAKVRWKHHLAPPNRSLIPDFLVQLSEKQQYIVTVDMNASRLYLFQNRNGVPHLINDFYVTIGKEGVGKYVEGDQKTPVGVYFVTGYIDSEELPDLYGDGAFPIDYPNAWDRRHNRTGYGIWLHGTPSNTYSRPPRDSNGCVIVSNQDLNTLAPYLEAGKTPVLLTNEINWISVDEYKSRQRKYARFIEQWRSDWESMNVDSYLRHYSRDYAGLGKDYESWVRYKRRVNSSKNFIKVNLHDTSMFIYPGEPDLLVVTFDQEYKSDNYQRRFTKRQYWRRTKDGTWKIIYEGSV